MDDILPWVNYAGFHSVQNHSLRLMEEVVTFRETFVEARPAISLSAFVASARSIYSYVVMLWNGAQPLEDGILRWLTDFVHCRGWGQIHFF